MSLKSRELFTADISGDGSIAGTDSWPGGPMYVLLYFSGSASVQVEITSSDLGGWVAAGSAMTQSGFQKIDLPDGVEYRVTVSGSSGLSGHVDLFVQ